MAAPSKGDAAKRQIITMRVTDRDRARIAAAAELGKRSISQEIESRLERSFDRDEDQGGAHIAAPINLISSIIRMIEQESGKRWDRDYLTWQAAKRVVDDILEAKKPRPKGHVAVAAAEEEYLAQAKRWRSLGKDRILREAPLDATATAQAEKDLQAAKDKLTEFAAPIREDLLVGRALADHFLAIFKPTLLEE